ncbi:MAG: RES family NAD+ phosphorylase [Clostridiaceae bacterium]|nr:RES family NAD+ phosphorylase [Clostridiaceae bacterium]
MAFRSRHLQSFVQEIQYKNRNPRSVRALELLEDLATNPVLELKSGAEVFRARLVNDLKLIHKEAGFFGFGAKESFVPPPEATHDMRANYRYIPYLYCASDPYIALMEVRPRLGSRVSVATIGVLQDIRLLDFTVQNKPRKMTDAKSNLFADLSDMFSKPIRNDDEMIDYIPTQFIAEYTKNLGYDGIAFSSSMTPEVSDVKKGGYNFVIFNFERCQAIKSNLFEAERIRVEARRIDDDTDAKAIRCVPLK